MLARIRRQKLFSPGETVVVAVSGGADSVALLDMLVQLQDERLNLVVAHLNHCLRGAASDADQAFVFRLAASYSLPFVAKRQDIAALAGSSRLSLEDAGRQARYAFFSDTAKAHGASSIAVAHHMDDQAETVLMRLLRGAGGDGLSAMSSVTGMIKRPLLQVSREEIEQYLKLRGLSFRTDATNSDTAILRNSIRHELIPLLKRYNPKVSDRLAATAQILACDEELLDRLTDDAYRRLARWDGSALVLDAESLRTEPVGLRLRLYRRALLEQRGDLQRIALNHLEAIDGLVLSERPNARVKLPGSCLVARCYGDLSFTSAEPTAEGGWDLEIGEEGDYLLPTGSRLTIRRVPRPDDLDPGSRRVAYLDPDRAPFPWLLRTFADGDRFAPLGMAGEQKVKDLFINEKVPLKERRRIPLLVSDGRIVWIAGVRMGESARVAAATTEVLRVEITDFTP